MKTILVYAACFGAVATSVFAEGDRRPEGDGFHRGRHAEGEHGGRGDEGQHRRPQFGKGGEIFKRMDADGDGLISKEEFFTWPRMARLPAEKVERIFSRLDRDRDGKLSKVEIDQIRKDGEERAREFRELDVDGSGGLNFAEFSEGKFFKKLPEDKRREIFTRLDTDGDGEVSPKDRPERARGHDGRKK